MSLKKSFCSSVVMVIAIFSFCVTSQAQLVETFDFTTDVNGGDGEIANGWMALLRSSVLGTTGTFVGNPDVFPAFSGEYLGMNFNNSGSLGPNDIISTWVVSPVITFNNGDQLVFWTRKNDDDTFQDRAEVRLSLAGDSLDVGTDPTDVGDFTELLLEINPNQDVDGYPQEWTEFTLEVSGLAGPTDGRFAFHYFVIGLDIDSDYIGLDEFMHVPGGGDCLIGDVNLDGKVNLEDVDPFVAALSVGSTQCEADIDGDGMATLEDVDPFVALLAGGG